MASARTRTISACKSPDGEACLSGLLSIICQSFFSFSRPAIRAVNVLEELPAFLGAEIEIQLGFLRVESLDGAVDRVAEAAPLVVLGEGVVPLDEHPGGEA